MSCIQHDGIARIGVVRGTFNSVYDIFLVLTLLQKENIEAEAVGSERSKQAFLSVGMEHANGQGKERGSYRCCDSNRFLFLIPYYFGDS